MFAYLHGILARKTTDSLIIDVNGIGYKVFVPGSAIPACPAVGDEIKVFTHFYVREDTQALYGFLTEEELKMFEQLLTVSGVGPKASLALVSNVHPSEFVLSVLTDDTDSFIKAPGIGKKTAQRIILELKDKLKKEHLDMSELKNNLSGIPSKNESKLSEAISALVMLGYSTQEASRAISAIYDDEKSIEQIVKEALKQMFH
ncbi:MAG: Holliday junction branch migration protein RuvA [Clostridiaceae bacterium]|jgi:Holliday junction DNA helicase RuvA|nr:Holliday junction branch migration protein RuvA [Clostridiaceae bacterium]